MKTFLICMMLLTASITLATPPSQDTPPPQDAPSLEDNAPPSQENLSHDEYMEASSRWRDESYARYTKKREKQKAEQREKESKWYYQLTRPKIQGGIFKLLSTLLIISIVSIVLHKRMKVYKNWINTYTSEHQQQTDDLSAIRRHLASNAAPNATPPPKASMIKTNCPKCKCKFNVEDYGDYECSACSTAFTVDPPVARPLPKKR